MFIKFVSQTHQSCLAPGYCSASLKLSVPNSKAPRRFWEYQNITWSSIYTFCTSLSTPHLYSPNVAHTLKHAKIQSKFIVHAPSQGRKEKWKEKETEGRQCIKIFKFLSTYYSTDGSSIWENSKSQLDSLDSVVYGSLSALFCFNFVY